jgi:hypothetical protein
LEELRAGIRKTRLEFHDFSVALYCPDTELTQVKQTIHKRTIQAISNNPAQWQDKVEVLANPFQQDVPAARVTVENVIMDMNSYDFDCYEFEDVELYNSTLNKDSLSSSAWDTQQWASAFSHSIFCSCPRRVGWQTN